jgi:dephospho-CoA kinase
MHRKTAKAEEDGDRVVLIEVPLLFELGLEERFDVVVVVSTDFELRAKRLMDRDSISREDAENLLNVQMPNKDKVERAEFVLTNEGSQEQLKKSVDLFYKKFLQKYTKRIESP